MNLQGIISVSGRSGLYKLIGQNKSGFILEALSGSKAKLVVNMSTSQMASLDDITIYGEDEDMKLQDIFEKISTLESVPDPKQADGTALRDFFRKAAPLHDQDRVYASDIKKIISWYMELKDLPLFSEKPFEDGKPVPVAGDEVKKREASHGEKSKPVQKAAGKGANRLPRKAS